MARIVIVGDGPAGLSAALFLAKNGHEAVVYGTDETAMHYALLRNYLGVGEEPGSTFQERARKQVAGFGADIRSEPVSAISRDGDGFAVSTASGEDSADYIILAGGKALQGMAGKLGVEVGPDGAAHDTEYRTGVDRVYAVGRLARPQRSQAIISAGAGAVAALDVLSREAGRDMHDWDTPEEG